MRCKEHVAGSCINMCGIDINTAMFKMQVCVNIDYRVFSDCHSRIVGILDSEQSDSTEIVRGMVAGKETYITAQLHAQNLGYAELQIEV